MSNPFPAHIVTGSLCYIFRDDKVLLLKRNRPPHIGFWSPPGGKMEHGESPQECCIREIREETGLTIEKPTLRAMLTSVDIAYPVHWHLFIFRAENPRGELIETPEGELRWIGLDELARYNRPYTDVQSWPAIVDVSAPFWQGKIVFDTPDNLLEEIIY